MKLKEKIESQCKLCNSGSIEKQTHTSTQCQHQELKYIRDLYKQDIDSILTAFRHIKLPKKHTWVRNIMSYVSKNMWGDTEVTADIWSGRWTRHMWEEALTDVAEKIRTEIDTKLCRKWLSIITNLRLSRHCRDIDLIWQRDYSTQCLKDLKKTSLN
jgi:hypothetical protein